MKTRLRLLFLAFTFFLAGKGMSQDDFSGKWYIGFQHQEEDNFNQFQLKRAYITYKPQITPWLSGRITPDITIDREGADRGNIELRLKYLYAQFSLNDFSIFTGSNIKVGLTPRPWIDYEQKINHYRAQGPMFLETADVINSTDYGLNFNTSFGKKYEPNGFTSGSPGTYGSMAIGVYNGGGYHAIEENANKTLEWRLTFRPFPKKFGGLLATYHGAWGNSNSIRNNRFRLNGVHLAYEHKFFLIYGEYYEGFGSYNDGFISERTYRSVPHHGYSAFAEFREPKTGLAAWLRYDSQYLDYTQPELAFEEERLIIAAVWRFHKNNKLILSYDKLYKGPENYPNTIWEATLDLQF